ncbi:MAG: tetratricopeptide repeat protein, partial [Anaerolineae bacterium]|nr:tetratricopeptide repeat protein [Anaerolineae bacterium]
AYAYLAEATIDDGQWSAANEAIAIALRLDATNVDVLRNQAYVLENQGNNVGANEAYRKAIAANNRVVHLYIAVGRNAGALGNLTTALDAYSEAVAVDPRHPEALARLAWTQILMGDYASAKQNLTTALEIDPDLAEAYAYLGTLYFHQRNYEDAIVAFGPAIGYAEARARRRTVLFSVTVEETEAIGQSPRGPEVAFAEFIHPGDLQTPMRGQIRAAGAGALERDLLNDSDRRNGSGISGQIRFDVMSGRYEASFAGLPPAPSGRVYVGWFLRLLSPESTLIRTEPIFPAPDGQAVLLGTTGTVKGPAIEHYYSYALSYYLLNECDKALPLIEVALRINPEDTNALTTRDLCR